MVFGVRSVSIFIGSIVLMGAAALGAEAERIPGDARLLEPVAWHETMEAGKAAAIKADRPIILVFPAVDNMRHEWFHESSARAAANASNAVMVRVLPPQQVNPPAGASDEMRRALQDAYRKVYDDYMKLIQKYNVTMFPTVLYLSPDGETVFRNYPRTMETTVAGYVRCLESDFANYRKARYFLRERLKAKGLEYDKTRLPDGEEKPSYEVRALRSLVTNSVVYYLDQPVTWYNRMKPAIEDATRADRPILLVLPAADRDRHEWFYGVDLEQTISGGKVTPVCIPAPAEFFVPRTDGKVLEASDQLKREMTDAYRAMCQKYNVTVLPTVLFITPDGETVLKSWPRTMETTVVEYFKSLPADFNNYKKLREVLRSAQKPPEKNPAGPAGPVGPAGTAVAPSGPATTTSKVDNF